MGCDIGAFRHRSAESGFALPPTYRTSTLDAAPAAVFVLDAEWRITFANGGWERLAAGSAMDVVGRTLWDVFPGLAESARAAILTGVLADGVARSVAVDYASSEECRELELQLARTATGDLFCELYDVRDATDEVAPVDESDDLADDTADVAMLRSATRQLSEATDSASVLRTATAFVQRECAADGAGVGVIQGDRVMVLHFDGPGGGATGSSYPIARSLTARVIRSGTVERERRYEPFDGPLRDIMQQDGVGEMMLAPLVAYNQTVGVLAASRLRGAPEFTAGDEHRLRLIADHAAVALWKSRLLEQARAANQAKTNFLATMSHELRTPLTALTGYSELLADDILGPMPPQQKDVVERMRAVTHHLTVLIDEVLAFSNLEGGREHVRAASVSLEELVYAVSAVARPLADQKGLDYLLDLPSGERLLTTDADKARQILVNLIGNAVKFTDRGQVVLQVREHDGEMHFLVTDTGMGIAAEDRGRLFQAFGQLDASLTRRHGGTGLGLYISGRLAHLLGGRIDVESEVGVGSTFRLVLPVAGPPAAADADRTPPGSPLR